MSRISWSVFLLTAAMIGATLAGAGAPDVAVPRRWWERVWDDIEAFKRPINDATARTKTGDEPIARKGRVFSPRPHGSPLRVKTWRLRSGVSLCVYYCEIDRIYWVHVLGGPKRMNLVTGPYTLGRGPTTTRPVTTQPAVRPAQESLTIRLEREGRGPVAAGAKVPVRLVLVNTGSGGMWVNVNPALARIGFRVRGAGVERRPLGVPGPAGPPARDDFVLVPPTGRHVIPLDDLSTGRTRYRLTLDGRYEVRATYANEHDGRTLGLWAWTGSVTSAPLVIRVVGQAP